jgi:hypothetical protein
MLYTGAVGTSGNRLPLVSLSIMILTFIAGTSATVLHWKYSDQNR